MELKDIKVGDHVTRNLAGAHMELIVSDVTTRIICGPWEFSRRNGAEIDEDLGWDELSSGSFITPKKED